MSKIFEMIDIEVLEELADIINRKELGEITIVDGGKTITVKGKKCPPPPPQTAAVSMPAVSPAVITEPIEISPKAEEISGTPVKAPIVGTYYSKPRPDAVPFVTVGSKVKKGDVLYILETMKVMNEVAAETDGIITKILACDGDSLEYGQTVMIIG